MNEFRLLNVTKCRANHIIQYKLHTPEITTEVIVEDRMQKYVQQIWSYKNELTAGNFKF